MKVGGWEKGKFAEEPARVDDLGEVRLILISNSRQACRRKGGEKKKKKKSLKPHIPQSRSRFLTRGWFATTSSVAGEKRTPLLHPPM
jgi:hypothetical protein